MDISTQHSNSLGTTGYGSSGSLASLKKNRSARKTQENLNNSSVLVSDKKFEIDFIIQKYEKKKNATLDEDIKREKYMEMLVSHINEKKTSSYMNLVNILFRDALYELVCKSVVDFVCFFENLIPYEVKVRSSNSVENVFKPEMFPKIKNIAESSVVLDDTSAFHAATDKPDLDLNTTYDVIDYVKSEETLIKFPLFHINLTYNNGSFEYSNNFLISWIISLILFEYSKLPLL